jgi:hypothetical protein
MTSMDRLDNLPSSLADAPAALDSLQEELQMLSAAWYRFAAEAVPGDGLSREQEVRLKGALHDVAAAFARCARACRGTDLSWFSSRTPPADRAA